MSNKSKRTQPQQLPAMQSLTMVHHSGPLPPPSEMRSYNELIPDAAARILAMAEKEQAARLLAKQQESARQDKCLELDEEAQRQSDSIIKINARNSITGLWLAFAFAVIQSILTVFLIYNGHQVAGSLFGGGSLAAIISAFIYGSHIKRRDILSNKDEKH